MSSCHQKGLHTSQLSLLPSPSSRGSFFQRPHLGLCLQERYHGMVRSLDVGTISKISQFMEEKKDTDTVDERHKLVSKLQVLLHEFVSTLHEEASNVIDVLERYETISIGEELQAHSSTTELRSF